jgi:hypothetical protein
MQAGAAYIATYFAPADKHNRGDTLKRLAHIKPHPAKELKLK